MCYRGAQTFRVINQIVASAISMNPTVQEYKVNNAEKLIHEALELLKTDPTVVFQVDVLRAILLLELTNLGLWNQFRLAVKKAHISLRDLDRAIKKEKFSQLQESISTESRINDEPEASKSRSFDSAQTDPSGAFAKYQAKDGCIFWNKSTKDGVNPIRLSNFLAKIEAEESTDDGIEQRRFFSVSGNLYDGRFLPTVSVPAEKFSSMDWVPAMWGANAITTAGMGNKDQLRAAIQEVSGEIPSRINYGHTGWRKIKEQWYYFFNGGAIGSAGLTEDFNVDLGSGKLKHFVLPKPPSGSSLKSAILASLSILNVAPAKITYPVFAALYRGVIGEAHPIDFSVFLFGASGLGKSELAALFQSHFGATFDGRNLPANWTCTANALELQASSVKDALLTIDDFAPQPNANDMTRLLQTAERLFRGVGNQAGRGRLTSDLQQRSERYPRGLILSTGEDLPRGLSLRARLLIVELIKDDICFDKLTVLQEYANQGLFAQAMSAYIRWQSERMDRLKSEFVERHRKLRLGLSSEEAHKRSADMVASITLGLEEFLKFAVESDAITQAEADLHLCALHKALVEIGDNQKVHQLSEDPVNRFLELIGAAITSGRAHVADSKTGAAPTDAEQWGWRRVGSVLEEKSLVASDTFISRGETIGWLPANGQLWLEPGISFAIVQKLAADQKTSLSISEQTLWKHLSERRHVLASPEDQRIQTRKSICKIRKYVLVFRDKNIIFNGEPSASEGSDGFIVDIRRADS